MIINLSKGHKVSMIHRATLYGLEKITLCANTLFSFVKEEGVAWKGFFSNNYYISSLCTLGSKGTQSIAKKFFSPPESKSLIDLSNTSLEELKSKNQAWIRDHSLFRKKYPNFNVSNKALIDVILSKDTDSKGVRKFAEKFLAHTREKEIIKSLSNWEKAHKKQQQIYASKNDPQKLEKISKELSQEVQNFTRIDDHIIFLFENEANTTDSPLSYYIKHGLNEIRPIHDNIYQTVYSNVKKQLQTHINTTWKKKLFTEIQEEIRAILLSEYSILHKKSTLGHHLPGSLQQLFSGNSQPTSAKESLPGLIWNLLLQNGVHDPSDQPISEEKLNQIFEKEFQLITSEVESFAMVKINQLIDKAGKDLQPLLQLWYNQLPQKDRGWLEIAYQSDTHYRVNLYARDRENAASNIRTVGESAPMKLYSYQVPKNLLKSNSFLELISPKEGGDPPISSTKNIKEFLSSFGRPLESYIPSNDKVASQGLLDHIKIFHLETSESPVDSTEKIFFQMRLHAFINYCRSIENKTNVTGETLLNVENGVSIVLESANKLYDVGQLSDEEYIAIISTGLEIEECVLEKQHNLREEVESSKILVPSILKDEVRKIFSSSGLSQVDVENIKSFSKVLLGNDMSEEIALLCKELPITSDKLSSFVLPHTTLWKTLKNLCLDVKNLRASPVAVFRLYSDLRKLLKNIRSLMGWISYIPYIYLIVSCCTNPVTGVVCVVGAAVALYLLFNIPELEPILNILAAITNFQKETYTFFLTRLILRALQLADMVLHWNKMAPMEEGRSLLTDNMSNRLSFLLNAPINPYQKIIPKELIPLQKFHPDVEIYADTENSKEVSNISFPKLSMEFFIQEKNGVKRAYLQGQPGFWIADLITDRRLESLDFAHLVLENEEGDRKICVVPRSEGRLILQTVLKMANLYSRKSVDTLSDYIRNRMLKNLNVVYYYDIVDGELVSQDFDSISYLITHYMTSGDITRSQKLVDQLRQMKANGRLESPNSIVKTLDQISAIISNSMNSKIAKIILELSSLCEEIPGQSKAFPLFLRAYQYYIESKEESGTSYLSETQEALLAQHVKDYTVKEQILSGIGKLVLATQSPWSQTPILLVNNLIDLYFPEFSRKESYIPTSLKNYELERKYLKGDNNITSLLLELMLNNLINPIFFINKDMVNAGGKAIKDGQINILEQLPLLISKLNIEKNTLKIDYISIILLTYFIQSQCSSDPLTLESMKKLIDFLKEPSKKSGPLLKGSWAFGRDSFSAFSTEPTNFYKLEEKFSGIMQSIFRVVLPENLDTFGREKPILDFHSRHIIQSGIMTLQNYIDIHKKSKKEQLLHDNYTSTFPELQIDKDYRMLHSLEESIVTAYQEINNRFLRKQERPSNTRPELVIQEGSLTENRIIDIANWYRSGRDREQNISFYTLKPARTREDLVNSLNKIHKILQEKLSDQQKILEKLLTNPLQNLSSLESSIKAYTQDIRSNSTAIVQTQEQISAIASQQSIIKKVGTFALGYINSLIEIPTFGKINLSKIGKIEQLIDQKKNLVSDSESIKSKRKQLFQNIIRAFKTETALGLSEVYDYFCQGKDALIIQSLGLNEDQWKILKEQLYQYMLLQKHLSIAENLDKICRSGPYQGITRSLDLIGYELDTMFNSLYSEQELELSVRSRLQFEKKLARSLSPDVRNKFIQIVNNSMENFQSIYRFCTSQ